MPRMIAPQPVTPLPANTINRNTILKDGITEVQGHVEDMTPDESVVGWWERRVQSYIGQDEGNLHGQPTDIRTFIKTMWYNWSYLYCESLRHRNFAEGNTDQVRRSNLTDEDLEGGCAICGDAFTFGPPRDWRPEGWKVTFYYPNCPRKVSNTLELLLSLLFTFGSYETWSNSWISSLVTPNIPAYVLIANAKVANQHLL